MRIVEGVVGEPLQELACQDAPPELSLLGPERQRGGQLVERRTGRRWLEPVEIVELGGRGRDEIEVRGTEARRHHLRIDPAFGRQEVEQGNTPCLARQAIGDEAVEEVCGPGPTQLELGEARHVEHTHALAAVERGSPRRAAGRALEGRVGDRIFVLVHIDATFHCVRECRVGAVAPRVDLPELVAGLALDDPLGELLAGPACLGDAEAEAHGEEVIGQAAHGTEQGIAVGRIGDGPVHHALDAGAS